MPDNNLKIAITHALETDGQITPAKVLDGKARTVGEKFTVVVKAFDRTAKDLSNIVTLEDSNGKSLGTGANIVYRASEPKNECLTARVKVGEQQSWDTVCFTVSARDVTLQDDVKVFDRPEEADNLLAIDLDRGFACFNDDASLQKKIKPEDKLVLFFKPVPQKPTLMPGELITPPIKVGARVPASRIYSSLDDLPNRIACFEAQQIFALTELIEKAETNYDAMPDIDFVSIASEEDATGFSRLKDEENPIVDEEGNIVDFNGNTIGFNDIKEGSPDGLDELIEGADLELDQDVSVAANLKSIDLKQLLTSQTDPERFGDKQGEPRFNKLAYNYKLTVPLIDVPSKNRHRPGQSIGGTQKKKCSAFFSDDQPPAQNQEDPRSFEMMGQLSFAAAVRSNLPQSISDKIPSLKRPRVNVLVDAAKKLANVNFEANPSISLAAGVTMEGSYPLINCAESWSLFEKRLPVTIPIPPLPLWIAFYLQVPLNLDVDLTASVNNAYVGLVMSGETDVKMNFNTLTGLVTKADWDRKKTKVNLKPIANGEASLDGRVRLSVEPTIKFLIDETIGPAVTLAANVQGNTIPPATRVSIRPLAK